jgi:hypothetical protein
MKRSVLETEDITNIDEDTYMYNHQQKMVIQC